jgi:hypothetical protein
MASADVFSTDVHLWYRGVSTQRDGLVAMKRFLTIIAATAVAAAITIPAVADSGAPPDELATFATCLRAHDIPIPADLDGVAVKEWIGAHRDTAGLDGAFKACDPNPRQGPKDGGPGPQELRECLAGKGLNPPTGLDELKPWVLQQSQTAAGKDVLKACGFAGVEEKHAVEDGGACGAGTGAGKAQARTSRARRPKAQTTPTT